MTYFYFAEGLAPDDKAPSMANDNKPYTTLLYANGPGYGAVNPDDGKWSHDRQDLMGVDTKRTISAT